MAPVLPLLPAQIDRFQITGVAGAGAAGVVYRAYDPKLQREVAIKVLAEVPSEVMATMRSQGAGSELLEEARAMAQISHPNVLPVYEVGVHERGVFLVTELVQGVTFREWVEARQPVGAVLAALRQAFEGLHAAHARGLLHRDFKPDNILVGGDGRVRVADFGLSRFAGNAAGGIGTPAYMAPELWAGGLTSTSSDVYACCVTLCEALLGVRPDLSDARRATALEAALRSARLAPALCAAILAGLAPDPARRSSSLAPLLRALDRPRLTRRRAGAVAGFAALMVTAITLGVVTSPPARDCALDPAWAKPWSAAQAAAVRLRMTAVLGARAPEVVDGITRAFATYQDALGALGARTCGEPGDREVGRVRSCLQRRAFALAALAGDLAARGGSMISADRAYALPPVQSCQTIDEAPMAEGRAAEVAALMREVAAADRRPLEDRATVTTAQDRAEVARWIERAKALGEVGLQAQLWTRMGILWRADEVTQYAEAFDRAYTLAFELRDYESAVTAVLEKVSLRMAHDLASAESLVQSLAPLLERPELLASTRVRAQSLLGELQWRRGRYGDALATLNSALALAAASGQPMIGLRINIHRGLAKAYAGLGRTLEQMKEAELALDLQDRQIGRDSHAYAVMMAIYGDALIANARRSEGVQRRFDALEALQQVPRRNPGMLARFQADVGQELLDRGELDKGEQLLKESLAAAAVIPSLSAIRPLLLVRLAAVEQRRARPPQAVALARQAYEASLVEQGKSTVTAEILERLAALQIEAGSLAEGEAQVSAAEQMYRAADPTGADNFVQLVTSADRAELALQRNRPAQAIALAAAGLRFLQETHGPEIYRFALLIDWGRAASKLGRFAEAAAKLEEAKSSAKANWRAEEVALAELELAKARFELGERDTALATVQRTLPVVAASPYVSLAEPARRWLQAHLPPSQPPRRVRRRR